MTHYPVLFLETLQQLAIKKDGIYIDCTFGRGGHSRGLLAQLGQTGQLLAIDRDIEAVRSEDARLLQQDSRFSLHHHRFSGLETIAIQQGVLGKVDGILIDLGVSSPQLDTPGRGFSFLREGNLDMRMDDTCGISAQQWLAEVSEKELVRVLFEYGEERFARRIAKVIVDKRALLPITDTIQLATLIADAVPFKEKHKHPATRSFQAIRIEINKELEELKNVLQQSIRLLKPGGRLVVIAFHSLEDRMVKRFIRDEAGAKFDPGKLPIKEVDIAQGLLKNIGKAIKASEQELVQNPRARSAVMRTAERVN